MINNSGTTITIKPTIITSPAYKHSHIHVAKATRLKGKNFSVVKDNSSPPPPLSLKSHEQ